MCAFKVVDGDHLDYTLFSNLQKKAYTQLMTKLQISTKYMTPKFYKWKFHPPAGSGKIALVFEKKHLVSTNAIFPIQMHLGQDTIIGWQATDAATLDSARRKGYSSGCLRTLLDSLKSNEVLFLFPNKTSIPYVDSMNSWNKGIITTWIKPAPLFKKRQSSDVTTITEFGRDHDTFAQQLTSHNKVILSRSADYLNWRYTRHPVTNYVSFIHKTGNEEQGFAVVRSVNLLGRKVAMVMELWGLNASIKKELLRSIALWADERKLKRIVFQDNGQSILGGLKIGFIAVPSWFLPKKQVLMVFASPGKLSEKIALSDWWVQIGDWDGL